MSDIGFLKMFQEQCQEVNQVFNEQDIGLEWRNVFSKGGSSSTTVVSTTQERTKTSTTLTSTTKALSSTSDVRRSTPTPSSTSHQLETKPPPPGAPTSNASIAHPADSPPTATPASDSVSTQIPSHTHSSLPSSTYTASSHSETHTQTKTIVAAVAGSSAFLVILGALFYIVRRRAHQSRVAAEDRWDPSRGVSGYGSPTLPNVDMGCGAGVYEKGADEEGKGDGLERYTRQGAKASPLGYRERDMRLEIGMDELRSPTLSELGSLTMGRSVAELRSPMLGSPDAELCSSAVRSLVVELHPPTFEARVAELGASVEKR
jgi:hypothetical protein